MASRSQTKPGEVGDLVVILSDIWVHSDGFCVLCVAGEEQAQRFLGNESHKDHFKLLEREQNSLLVGAR
jgi:hypothetical protein